MGNIIHDFAEPYLMKSLRNGEVRRKLASTIEALIELLDLVDGDPDIEDDDPAGGSADDVGEVDESRGLPLPRYGIDQTRDPLNAASVQREWFFDPMVNRCINWKSERAL